MKFTGNNLLRIRMAVVWALSDLHSQIGSCPDVFEYAEDIEELEAEIAQLEKLKARIERALVKEGTAIPND